MNIADRILKLRKDAGLSQEALAEKLGVSRQSVSKWESGNVMPDIDKVVSMCEIFSVSTDYLLKGEKSEPAEQPSISDDTEPIPTVPIEEIYIPEKPYERPQPEPIQEAEIKDDETTEKEPDRKTKIKAVAIVLAVCVLIAAIIPIPLGGYKKLWAMFNEEPVQYPYVLVHGMGGWGESSGINSLAPYWGSTSGSISGYLRGKGLQVYEATVGPFSSAWDRACELYAQLTGTQVDYGAAHSAEHGHERYGKTYATPLYGDWGQETKGGQLHKINLIGHSFGGNTIRLLASLMEYGSEAERNATKENISPLFEGGKGEYINSVTTLCSPHNGSTLYYVIDKDMLIPAALALLQTAGGITDMFQGGIIDFQLEHFGIITNPTSANALINTSFMQGTDNAFYDLSPHGAAELNKTIKTVDSIYYFSYAYCTTQKAPYTGQQTPSLSTMFVLMPFARLIGGYTNIKDDAPIKIDESWQPNDGLVNVVSAQYPFTEKSANYSEDAEIERGIWYVFPTLTGDHGTVIGMNGNAAQTQKFYSDLTSMIDALPRIK